MSASGLKLNDPVHVNRDSSSSSSSTPVKAGGASTLEGIVACLGPVDFNSDDDWIGVRLTGSSVGLGKNDGTVKGKKYFDCPTSCGMFIKSSAVTKRQLTRLEELKLRRELGSSSSSSTTSRTRTTAATTTTTKTGIPKTPASKSTGGTTGMRTPSTNTKPSSLVSPKPSASAATTSADTADSTSKTPSSAKQSTASRLEEIKKRRAQLQQKTSSSATTTATASVTAATAAATAATTTTTATATGSGSTSTSKPAAIGETGTAAAGVEKDATSTSNSAATAAAAASSLLLAKQVRELQSQVDSIKKDLLQSEEANTQKSTKIQSLEQDLKLALKTPIKSPTPIKKKQVAAVDDDELEAANNEIIAVQAQLEDMERQLNDTQKQSQQTIDTIQTKFQQSEVLLAAAKAEVSGLTKELTNRDLEKQDEAKSRTSESNHYKERAKLQADVASLSRRVEQLEVDKQELEHNVEDLVLDKDSLQEEKESLEDRLEEVKLDSETATMELEETKMELEDARTRIDVMGSTNAMAAAAGGSGGGGGGDDASAVPATGGDHNNAEQADIAHNLSIQNARLREALIRLREQSSVEKMDLSRQVRSSEKYVEESKNLTTEVETLRETNKVLDEQISDLKDMVEQGSAYEIMVEDLSDRLLSLEEELTTSIQQIREMEEDADITAEMEEVQTEELKSLNRDMEDRETVIRNLEEAIKMQRKREEDFQKTVSNYRKSAETLKQEKSALLELHQGGEGEKSDLVSASQKALARAAQLVQDAAEMRKREAQAAIDRIDSQVRLHLSERLESMLPSSVAASEVASIKGELLLSKVVGKSSLSLDGIARSFAKTIRVKSWEWRSNNIANSEEKDGDDDVVVEEKILSLSDEQQQMAATMIHQSEVAHVAIDVSGDLLWLLSAGQWPELLSTEASSELGAIMGHSMNDLDIVLGNVLNTLKEEGVLSPHQSNIGAFRQTVVTTMQTLRSHIEQDGVTLLPMDWKPPALKLFRNASRAKYSSLGCYAAVACILNVGSAIKTNDDTAKSQELIAVLKPLLRKLDQAASEAAKSCLRLAKLDVLDETIVSSLSEAADIWRASSDDLLGNVYNMLLSEEGLTPESIGACEAATDEVVRVVSHFATVLRSANLTDTDDNKFHPFSPEIADVWEGVTMLARAIRSKDGDEEDVNYLIRTRTIADNLEDAVESVPELSLAKAKVSSLEKSLSLRSKENSMQNARLTDLEKMLARSNAQPSSRLVASQVSSDEAKSLKQENRYLSEAMDVLHKQVEEYENEIRARDSKTPAKTRSRTRRAFTPDSRDSSRSSENLRDLADEGNMGAFEAALFRPALQAARKDAAQWKANATINTLLELPPLNVSMHSSYGGEEKFAEEDDPLFQLSSALSTYQRETASVRIVDITKSSKQSKSPRMQLHDMMMRKAAASEEVDKAAAAARQWLERRGAGVPKMETTGHPLVGRVKFAGPEPCQTIPTSVTGEDLYRIQLNLGK